MGLREETRVIDSQEYTTTQFPALFGLRLKVALAKKLAPALSELLGGSGASVLQLGDLMNLDIGVDRMGSALAGFFAQVSEDEAEDLLLRVLQWTKRGDALLDRDTINANYGGDYGSLFRVVAWVLKVNYGSLMSGANVGSIMNLAGKSTDAPKDE
jgi:methionine aminopeptidase